MHGAHMKQGHFTFVCTKTDHWIRAHWLDMHDFHSLTHPASQAGSLHARLNALQSYTHVHGSPKSTVH